MVLPVRLVVIAQGICAPQIRLEQYLHPLLAILPECSSLFDSPHRPWSHSVRNVARHFRTDARDNPESNNLSGSGSTLSGVGGYPRKPVVVNQSLGQSWAPSAVCSAAYCIQGFKVPSCMQTKPMILPPLVAECFTRTNFCGGLRWSCPYKCGHLAAGQDREFRAGRLFYCLKAMSYIGLRSDTPALAWLLLNINQPAEANRHAASNESDQQTMETRQ
jgi:hypothetical protein